MTNSDLQNRLEEAAEQYATKVVPEGIFCHDEYFNDTISSFRDGAEFGYKKAINVAKEWIENQWKLYYEAGKLNKILASFEADMLKLLEEKK